MINARRLAMVVMATLLLGVNPKVGAYDSTDEEALRHFLAILRLDTQNPPGNEVVVVDYLKNVLEEAGIETRVFALDPKRPNLVARLRGSGVRRPLLVMGHTDVVTVDAAKWKHPPFSATREGGYIYARGTQDDKPSVVAGLMTMLQLKRSGVRLDRDVVFLAEASELLAQSLDPEDALRRLAELAVGTIADWCGIDLVNDDGSLRKLPAQSVDTNPSPDRALKAMVSGKPCRL